MILTFEKTIVVWQLKRNVQQLCHGNKLHEIVLHLTTSKDLLKVGACGQAIPISINGNCLCIVIAVYLNNIRIDIHGLKIPCFVFHVARFLRRETCANKGTGVSGMSTLALTRLWDCFRCVWPIYAGYVKPLNHNDLILLIWSRLSGLTSSHLKKVWVCFVRARVDLHNRVHHL